MKRVNLHPLRIAVVALAFMFVGLSVSAQATATKSYADTKKEIESMFGFFPLIFKAFPMYALPGAWEAFKEIGGPEGKIPPKYRELLQLAVASQIPCIYCIYFHTESAKMYGATDEEIKEAIAQGASTRHWSIILQGNEVDYEAFKKEVQLMLKKMSETEVKK
jgi:AhpD family alkylhydroperoxidase